MNKKKNINKQILIKLYNDFKLKIKLYVSKALNFAYESDDDSFIIKKLLLNSYQYEELSCSSRCYRLNVNDERVTDAIIIFKNDHLYEMSISDFQNSIFLVKFENFVHESTNIIYMPPDGYEIIAND